MCQTPGSSCLILLLGFTVGYIGQIEPISWRKGELPFRVLSVSGERTNRLKHVSSVTEISQGDGKAFGFAQGLSRRGMPGIQAKAQAQLWDILELRLNWVDAGSY